MAHTGGMTQPLDNPDALRKLNDPGKPTAGDAIGGLAEAGLGELFFSNPIIGILGVFALIAGLVFATRDRK